MEAKLHKLETELETREGVMVLLLSVCLYFFLPVIMSIYMFFFCLYIRLFIPGLGSRSRVFLAPWSRSRLKKNQEPQPEPLGKKSQEPEPLKNQPALQPSEKIKSLGKLYFNYSTLGKILRFMVKKTIILFFYIFLQFYLTSLRGKEYFAKEPEPGVFGPLEPQPEPLGKKTRSRSRLKKKSGAGAAKKFAGSPAL